MIPYAITAATTPATRLPAINGQRYGFRITYAFENVSSVHVMCGVVTLLPVIFMPNHRQNPYMGTMVQGLLIKAPVRTTSLLSRKTHAKKRQLIACNPMVGVNAMNTPRAKADANLFGESCKWRRLLMRSLIYFIRILTAAVCLAERSA
jgi:hypothetical protein